jgi:hypothetical protein
MNASHRLPQGVLIASTLVASWLGMQAAHELGHVAAAWLTGGKVQKVVLHPLAISRTDVSPNPQPRIVVWAGPVIGALLPLALWGLAAWMKLPGAFALRFFAGFCLLANGLYIGLGSFGGVGDCGEMLRHGSPIWLLWLFGAVAAPAGLRLWHKQGPHFGLGEAQGRVSIGAACGALAVCALLVILGLAIGGE